MPMATRCERANVLKLINTFFVFSFFFFIVFGIHFFYLKLEHNFFFTKNCMVDAFSLLVTVNLCTVNTSKKLFLFYSETLFVFCLSPSTSVNEKRTVDGNIFHFFLFFFVLPFWLYFIFCFIIPAVAADRLFLCFFLCIFRIAVFSSSSSFHQTEQKKSFSYFYNLVRDDFPRAKTWIQMNGSKGKPIECQQYSEWMERRRKIECRGKRRK